MTTSDRRTTSGFTLVEVLVVLGVLGVLLATAVPLAGSLVDAERRQDVNQELAALETALEAFYEDNGGFPATLTEAGFYGVYLQPGVNGTAVVDAWGSNLPYAYSLSFSPDVARIFSVGDDGSSQGFANEEQRIEVFGAIPGQRTTRRRMTVILAALAVFVESGGTVTGTWSVDRPAMGLGSQFDNDGFGQPFRLGVDLVLESAGPDRVFGTGDDLGV